MRSNQIMIKYKGRKKIIEIPSIVGQFKTMASGATTAFLPRQLDKKEVEQLTGGFRPADKFNFIGAFLTKPNYDQFAFNLSYTDRTTGRIKEDFFLFTDERNCFSLEKLKPKDVKNRFPNLYKNYHYGDKSFSESLKRDGDFQ